MADSTLLDQLFADERLRPLLRRRLSPLLAEIVPGQLDTLQNQLWAQDFLPALTTAQDDPLPQEATEREPYKDRVRAFLGRVADDATDPAALG